MTAQIPSVLARLDAEDYHRLIKSDGLGLGPMGHVDDDQQAGIDALKQKVEEAVRLSRPPTSVTTQSQPEPQPEPQPQPEPRTPALAQTPPQEETVPVTTELDLQAATEPPSDAEAQPEQDAEVAQASFELGTALIGAADYQGARSAYLSALKMGHPDPHRCRNGAGVSAALEGNQQEAIAQFTASLALEPGDARTLHNRAQAYRALGRWKQAEADAKAAAEFDPEGDGGTQHPPCRSALVCARVVETLTDVRSVRGVCEAGRGDGAGAGSVDAAEASARPDRA